MKTDNQFNYGRYLASREWALKKEAIRERCKGWCERCAVGKYEDTHHLTYERIGKESLDDLQAICRQCHEYLSGKTAIDPCDHVKVIAVAVDIRGSAGRELAKIINPGLRCVGTPTGITFWPEEVSQIPDWAAGDARCSFGAPIITNHNPEKGGG